MRKVHDISGAVWFKEIVSLPNWFTTLLIISGVFVVVLTGVLGFATKTESSETFMALAIVVPLQLLITLFYKRMKLEKIVTSNGVYYRWNTLHRKFRYIEKNAIEGAEVKKGPMLKYGPGWAPGYGKFHSVNDKKGLQLFLIDNKRIFFGTEKIELFQKAVNRLVSEKEKRFREF